MSWTPDGKQLVYFHAAGNGDIWVVPVTGEKKPGPNKWQVSTDGGLFPRWRADGRELFFIFANTMLAADIRVSGASLQPGVPRSLFGLGDPSANHFAYHRFAVTADGRRFLISQAGAAGRVGGGGLADQLAAAADQIEAPAALSGNPVTVILNWTRLLNKN